jgi:hypothetical protein
MAVPVVIPPAQMMFIFSAARRDRFEHAAQIGHCAVFVFDRRQSRRRSDDKQRDHAAHDAGFFDGPLDAGRQIDGVTIALRIECEFFGDDHAAVSLLCFRLSARNYTPPLHLTGLGQHDIVCAVGRGKYLKWRDSGLRDLGRFVVRPARG